MMNDPSVNVHDVQAAFYKWQAEQKDSGKVEGGRTGTKRGVIQKVGVVYGTTYLSHRCKAR